MVKSIKAELNKILHKKGIYILTLIFILYTILTNVIYKNLSSYELISEDINIEEIIDINNSLDLNNKDDLLEYISNLEIIETINLKEKYNSNNQKYLIDNYLSDLIYQSYDYKYIKNNETAYNKNKEKIEVLKEKIVKEDWKYFINLKVTDIKNKINNENDSKVTDRYIDLLKLYNYRIENNIDFDNTDYLNNALEELEINLYEYYNLLNKDNLSNNEKDRLEYLNELYSKNEYILKNKKDINNNETLRSVLINFPSEFGLFILIYILMISASIVSEEFNKGTIKYLLTKPYKRCTILTSKLITVLLLIPTIILFMVTIELIIGGLILDFSSLKVPVLIYDSINNCLISYNVFTYLFKSLLYSFPIYIILGIFSFMLSTITLSTSSATTITFLFYLICNVISNLALTINLKIFKVFISLHWDFSYLIHLYNNPYNIKPWVSIIAILVYICTMLCISYIYFNKKDVKNI